MTLQIGHIALENSLFVAPMAGVTDRPFRMLCRELGAGYAVSEMVTSRKELWGTLKTSRRANHDGELGPISVQIAGTDADMMFEAAQYNIDRGAQIIDINMGCPAKKVCNKWAGSALDARRAAGARDRRGGGPCRTAARGAGHAEDAHRLERRQSQRGDTGAPLRVRPASRCSTVHGRTREQGYKGRAEYDTIAAVKAAVRIPVVANGDITSPEKARDVLALTGADAIMIGRAAQGRPWIFREIAHFLDTGTHRAPPLVAEVRRLMLDHLKEHYALYGDYSGVRTARKHIGWYVRALARRRGVPHCDERDRGLRCATGAPWPGSSTRWRGRWTAFLPQPEGELDQLDEQAADAIGVSEHDRTRGEEEKAMSKKHIEDCVRRSLDSYFRDLRGTEPDGMYEMLVRVVEKPLLDVVMKRTEGNQSRPPNGSASTETRCARSCVEHKFWPAPK